MFNNRLKKELQQLRNEFEQYKYDQENKPIYKVGDKLKDGTIIIVVEKINVPMCLLNGKPIKPQQYCWFYKGVKKGKIININK